MSKLPKRFVERARKHLRRYQKVLDSARARDINESDTVVIISDFLSDVLGYDKYEEITTEYAIRGTYCDLAIKRDSDIRFLIEVKAAGKDLKESHLRQATDYGASEGVEWVLLTNGIEWHAYRMRFEKPVQADLVFTVDLLDPDTKVAEILEKLYLLSREAGSGDAIDEYRQQKEATSRYILAQLLLGEPVLKLVRRELRRISPGVKVNVEELADAIQSDVLKRDVVEGERAKERSNDDEPRDRDRQRGT
jgi:hypothetical protein